MGIRDDVAKVAIYWDFENLHATLINQLSGDSSTYKNSRNTSQQPILNLDPILDYAASFGDIIINKAYANWQWLEQYRHALMAGGVDLIQMFPRGQNMKNSADIRLAIDSLTDVYTHAHLSHIVIVSSDSDFISLAQRIKQAGRFVAGIGLDGATNRFWPLACSEFKFYQNLLPNRDKENQQAEKASAPIAPDEKLNNAFTEAVSAPTLDEAKIVLDRVVRQMVSKNGVNFCASAGVKSMVTRALPTFDEHALGFGGFTDFLAGCPDIVKIVDKKSGGHIEHVGIASTNIG